MEPADPYTNDDANSEEEDPQPRALPDDLPKSLDDRRTIPIYGGETEMYDAWQGQQPSLLIFCPIWIVI